MTTPRPRVPHCRTCRGIGTVLTGHDLVGLPLGDTCPDCHGTGQAATQTAITAAVAAYNACHRAPVHQHIEYCSNCGYGAQLSA